MGKEGYSTMFCGAIKRRAEELEASVAEMESASTAVLAARERIAASGERDRSVLCHAA